MGRIIRLTECDLNRIVKRVLNEQSVKKGVEQQGECFKWVGQSLKNKGWMGGDEVCIMKHTKKYCQWKKGYELEQGKNIGFGELIDPVENECPKNSEEVPENKFYLYPKVSIGPKYPLTTNEGYYYFTNNGKGYNTFEEAKGKIKELFNPDHQTGRVKDVRKGSKEVGWKGKIKTVTKYDKEGKPIKQIKKTNYKDEEGVRHRSRNVKKTGL